MTFEKGISGNPAGRPKGIKDKRVALRERLEEHSDEIIAKLVEMAKDGDGAAMRICIDRLIPPAKSKDDPIQIPGLAGSLSEQGRTIIDAMAAGDLSPEEAGTIMQTLTAHLRIVEVEEIEQRVKALEAYYEQTGKSGR